MWPPTGACSVHAGLIAATLAAVVSVTAASMDVVAANLQVRLRQRLLASVFVLLCRLPCFWLRLVLFCQCYKLLGPSCRETWEVEL